MLDRNRSLSSAVLGLAILSIAAPLHAQDSGSDRLKLFEEKIRPVLATRCFVCHSTNAVKVQGGLLLDSPAGLKRGGNSGEVIVPGDPEKSLLVHALRYQDKDLEMPPGKPLPDGTPGPSLYCAVIVKRVDEKTRSKTSINELLRD